MDVPIAGTSQDGIHAPQFVSRAISRHSDKASWTAALSASSGSLFRHTRSSVLTSATAGGEICGSPKASRGIFPTGAEKSVSTAWSVGRLVRAALETPPHPTGTASKSFQNRTEENGTRVALS